MNALRSTRLAGAAVAAIVAIAAGCRSTVQGTAEPARSPDRVEATSYADGYVEVCWAPVARASAYQLVQSTDATLAGAVADTPTAGNCERVAGLGTASTWWFAVGAIVGSGGSATTAARSRPIAAALPGRSGVMGPPTRTWDGSIAAAEFGGALFPAGDVGGNGWPDFAVSGLSPGRSWMQEIGGGPALGPDDLTSRLGCELDQNAMSGTSALVGFSVGAADLDGDGYDDLLVGTPGFFDGASFVGQVAILLGGPGAACPPYPGIDGADPDGRFGQSVAVIGAFAGESDPVFAVGAPGASPPTVTLYAGLSSIPVAGQTRTGGAGSEFGAALASFGPNFGESQRTFAIGAPGDVATQGAVYVYGYGHSQSFTGSAGGDAFGIHVAPAGDVDGDGLDDLLIATGPRSAQNGPQAWLVLASQTFPLTSPVLIYQGDKPTGGTGMPLAIAGAGDVDGDGYADVLIGDPAYANGTGRVLLLRGGPALLAGNEPALWELDGPGTLQHFGASVAGIGDVDGDGFGDIAVGTPNHGADDEGEVQVWRGHAAIGIAVDAGAPARASLGFFHLVGSSFFDPVGFGPYRWTIDCDEGATQTDSFDVQDPYCSFTRTGRHAVTLRVDAPDGRFGEALTTVEVMR